MSLLPQDATFEELVQECFLAFKGSGLMLSALDAELVTRWAEKNVPYEVVARGIRRAAERAAYDARPDEPPIRSLRACKSQVEREFKGYLGRVVGQGSLGSDDAQRAAEPKPEPYDLSRHRKLRSALKALATSRPSLGPVIHTLKSGILAGPPRSLDEAAKRGDKVAAALLRALPFEERRGLLVEVRERTQVGMTPRARKLSRRFHRGVLLSQRLGLPALG